MDLASIRVDMQDIETSKSLFTPSESERRADSRTPKLSRRVSSSGCIASRSIIYYSHSDEITIHGWAFSLPPKL
jgi:hypothetical protein